ncbi:hypothetical protein [Limobrevibacterium gyesilva]|uniref:Uncharacterized protein n=1 Tax=Limobrevibacterium gyesilva TaxID=2991712 RepID=A0AA42CEL6_9PROT|nr:hypothetical protein [Limobrevibacterium gyesilva]MCW3475444.1 hypothetical protein [Limobrevibacterium gyesilva]
MFHRPILLAAAGALALLAATPAHADWDRGNSGWRHQQWRAPAWRDRHWRPHDWRAHAWRPYHPYRSYAPPAAYHPPHYGYYGR